MIGEISIHFGLTIVLVVTQCTNRVQVNMSEILVHNISDCLQTVPGLFE